MDRNRHRSDTRVGRIQRRAGQGYNKGRLRNLHGSQCTTGMLSDIGEHGVGVDKGAAGVAGTAKHIEGHEVQMQHDLKSDVHGKLSEEAS